VFVDEAPVVKLATSSNVRIIHCPKDFSLGTLEVIGYNRVGVLSTNLKIESKNALGDVSIPVRPDSQLKLDLHARVLRDPAKLICIKNDRIDQIRIKFLPMDEGEDGLVDKALFYVSGIKSLLSVNVDNSDASDVGVSYLKSLPHLETISFYRTAVTGSCLEALSSCPDLSDIHAWHCTLNSKYLKYLPRMAKLGYLNLCSTGLHDSDLKSVGECTQLYNLRLGNVPITDRGLKYLVNLKRLKLLDLAQTGITVEGLKQLKGLPLINVTVPTNFDPKAEPSLRKMFPGAMINRPHITAPSSETMEMFAPQH